MAHNETEPTRRPGALVPPITASNAGEHGVHGNKRESYIATFDKPPTSVYLACFVNPLSKLNKLTA